MTHGILLIYMERWGVGALSLVLTKSLPWRCVKQHLPVSLNPTLLEFYLISLAAITFVLLLQTCLLILRQYFNFILQIRDINYFQESIKGSLGTPSSFSFLVPSIFSEVQTCDLPTMNPSSPFLQILQQCFQIFLSFFQQRQSDTASGRFSFVQVTFRVASFQPLPVYQLDIIGKFKIKTWTFQGNRLLHRSCLHWHL